MMLVAGNQSINWPPLHLSVEPVSPRSLLDTSITASDSHWLTAATLAANEGGGLLRCLSRVRLERR